MVSVTLGTHGMSEMKHRKLVQTCTAKEDYTSPRYILTHSSLEFQMPTTCYILLCVAKSLLMQEYK